MEVQQNNERVMFVFLSTYVRTDIIKNEDKLGQVVKDLQVTIKRRLVICRKAAKTISKS